MWVFIFFVLYIKSYTVCSLCGITGSYLRVEQLGYGWLIPDEQVDADYNPATINDINGKRLFLNFSIDNNFGLNISNEQKFFGMNVFYASPLEKLKFAFRYKPLLTLNSLGADDKILTDEFDFLMFFGFPIKYNFKTGISLGITTYDKNRNNLLDKTYSQDYLIKTGVIFNLNELWNVGISFGGIFGKKDNIVNNVLTQKDDNLTLTFSLLPEFIYFKHDINIIVRTFLSLYYESILSELSYPYLWINEDESYYNLNMDTGIGFYLEVLDKTVLTIGSKYSQIFNNKNKEYLVNTINTTEYSGFNVSVFAGVEKTIITDRILLRAGYNIMKIQNYSYNYYMEQNSILVLKSSWDIVLISFLPELNNNINIGMSIKLRDDILFNFSFGKNLIYFNSIKSNNKTTETIKTGFDIELNFVFE